jgi:hypothetical protein
LLLKRIRQNIADYPCKTKVGQWAAGLDILPPPENLIGNRFSADAPVPSEKEDNNPVGNCPKTHLFRRRYLFRLSHHLHRQVKARGPPPKQRLPVPITAL